MKKNVASQVVGAQLNSKTDGSAVTSGTTTVYVTGDAGTQAAGSVGSGSCTHEGQGFWTYAPAQAETNYDHVAFTFTNSTAVAATVQIYTSFPQTVDNATNITAIKTKTDFLPSATAGAAGGVFIAGTNAATTVTTSLTTTFTGNLTGSVASVTGAVGSVTGSVGSVASGGITAASFAANAITAAKLDPDVTTELQAGLATSSALATLQTTADDIPNTAELATALGTADDAVLAQVALVKTETDKIAAVKAKTDSLTFGVAGHVDANIQYVNDVLVTGDGQPGTEWGP